MRRFVSLMVVLLFALPFGAAISGCSKSSPPVYCSQELGNSGPTVGQLTNITLTPKVYGVSLNFAEIGQVTGATGTDCKGSNVPVTAFVYSTSDMTLADIQPTSGRVCGGTWNRNTGGGIPDYTVCNPTNKSGTAYVTASADGVSSNPLPIFIHPGVTSIVLGSPSNDCTTDPTTSCCPLATTGVVTAPPYSENSCISQGTPAQLVARVFSGTGANQQNISCLAGHLQFSAQNTVAGQASNVVSIDQNGVATAQQPGTVLITANVSNASSSAGFFSTCPPASISLTAPGVSTDPVVTNLNNFQPLQATIFDTNKIPLTGLTLEYVSTAPNIIPASTTGSVTPVFAGSASIEAICQPPSCNPASYSQIGLFGTGKPITSNAVNFTTPGNNSTVLYMASTQSQYLVQRDFTSSAVGAPFQLPYYPNSMVLSNDGSTLYLGSSIGLMVLSAINNVSISRTDVTSPGNVLAVSPDNNTVVLTDPVRQTITLQTTTGTVITTYGGVGYRAQWTPDSQYLYITTGTVTTPATNTTPAVIQPGNGVLIFSNFTGWTSLTNPNPASDVTITDPSVGAYFAGPTTVARSFCHASTQSTSNGVISTTNDFYPQADSATAVTDRIAATNNGQHVLGATVTPVPTLNDLAVQIPIGNVSGKTTTVTCPLTGSLQFANTVMPTLLSSIKPTAITGVVPTTDSSIAFVTYTGTGSVLPAYAPATSGPGTVTYVPLSGSATAPIVGVESSDNLTFYVGTSGDNLVHLIDRNSLKDTSTLAPTLQDATGKTVPVNLMAQKPRRTT